MINNIELVAYGGFECIEHPELDNILPDFIKFFIIISTITFFLILCTTRKNGVKRITKCNTCNVFQPYLNKLPCRMCKHSPILKDYYENKGELKNES